MEQAAESAQDSEKLSSLDLCGGGCQSELFLQLMEVISSLEMWTFSRRSTSAVGPMEDHIPPMLHSTVCSTILPTSVMPELKQEWDQKSIQSEISRLREQNTALRFKLMVTDVELDRSKVTLRDFIDEKKNLQRKVNSLQDILEDNENSLQSPTIPGGDALCDQYSSLSDPQPSDKASLSTLKSLIHYLQSLPGIKHAQPGTPEVQPNSLQVEMEWLKGRHEWMKRMNDQLSVTLKECKTDSEKLSMYLGILESTCTALRLALQSSEKCLRTYSVLLALAEAKEEILLGQVAAGEFLSAGWSLLPKDLEIKTKLFLMEVKKTFCREGPNSEVKKKDTGSPAIIRLYAPWLSDEEEQTLQDYVKSLKFDLTSRTLQEQQHMGKDGTSHSQEVAHLANVIKTKVDNAVKSTVEVSSGHQEKPLRAQIVQELTDTKECLSEVRANLQLLQTEKRALELQIATEMETERAYMLIRDQLQMELSELAKGEEDSRTAEKYTVYLKNACSHGEQCGQPLDMQHLLDSLVRSTELRTRVENLTLELDKLSCKVRVQKALSAQVINDFFKAHRNLFITYQNACRKYKEQQHKLESQAVLMSQRQCQQLQDLMKAIVNLQAQKTARDTSETSL
ncbi:colorectal mutant cancer protein-like isoform X1 [Pelobates fuscus]|uniref:colorectal mutant cancer protein-like isoform X1 n=1 Tax=Pelobates fuscus TaxID=191477 RepID=UPI002FE46CE4